MSTPALTYDTPATVIISEPGNGTRYRIVYGSDFVALPDFGVAATMSPHPVEYGYIQQKLGLTETDARAVFAALNPPLVPEYEHLDGSVCEDVTQFQISPEDDTLFVCDEHDRRTKKVSR